MSPRAYLGGLVTETNVFSPIPTGYDPTSFNAHLALANLSETSLCLAPRSVATQRRR